MIIMAAQLEVNGLTRPGAVRHPTAPGNMMNSHFAGVGEDAPNEAYEHGIQVIDEDKVFKYVSYHSNAVAWGALES